MQSENTFNEVDFNIRKIYRITERHRHRLVSWLSTTDKICPFVDIENEDTCKEVCRWIFPKIDRFQCPCEVFSPEIMILIIKLYLVTFGIKVKRYVK